MIIENWKLKSSIGGLIFLFRKDKLILLMSQTLYRKYRPAGFADLSGQNHIKVTLQNEIAAGKIAHAYLFTGPRGTGKTTTARIFAKAINCENSVSLEGEPCNKCEACISIAEGRALDVIEMDAASQRGIDNVRENIILNARFTPSRLKYKVFIIDEVHMLTGEAWNALLKTIEEPPAHALLILATTEVNKVPATIISRCQRFDFHRINAEALVQRLARLSALEGVEVEVDVLYAIARLADGSLRDAESMLGQILSLNEKHITVDVASIVLPHSSAELVLNFYDLLGRRAGGEALALISKLVEEGMEPRAFTDELIEFGRKILLTKFSGSLQEFALGFDTAHAAKILQYVDKFSVNDLTRLLQILMEARDSSSEARIAQLPLELALVEYCESDKLGAPNAESEERVIPVMREVQKIENKSQKVIKSESWKVSIPKPEAEQAHYESGLKSETVQTSIHQSADKPQTENSTSLEEVTRLWPEFVRRVGLSNHSLPFVLGVGKPVAVAENLIQVGVHYKFHADRINDPKHREVLNLVASEVFGSGVRITGVVDAGVDNHANPLIKKALEAFGGRVVE